MIDNPNLPIEISHNLIYDNSKRELTEKVIARWYRAPEIILNTNIIQKQLIYGQLVVYLQNFYQTNL